MKPHVAVILVLAVAMTGLWLWEPSLFELDLSGAAEVPARSREYGAALLGLLLLGLIAFGADWRDWL